MPDRSNHADQQDATAPSGDEIQPMLDAAAGEPRSGLEPEGATDGPADESAGEHHPPEDLPSVDNTDRRA